MELSPKTPVRFRTAADALNRALDALTIAQDVLIATIVAEDPYGLRNYLIGLTRPVANPANAAGVAELRELVDIIHKLRWASEAVVTAEDAKAFFDGARARALEEENADLPF